LFFSGFFDPLLNGAYVNIADVFDFNVRQTGEAINMRQPAAFVPMTAAVILSFKPIFLAGMGVVPAMLYTREQSNLPWPCPVRPCQPVSQTFAD